MKKKTICIILSITLLNIVGCGKADKEATNSKPNTSASTSPITATSTTYNADNSNDSNFKINGESLYLMVQI